MVQTKKFYLTAISIRQPYIHDIGMGRNFKNPPVPQRRESSHDVTGEESPLDCDGENMTEVTKNEDTMTDTVLPPAPREDMVNKAIDFLLNPKTQQSPLAQRKAFLIKKGLTAEEVDMAITRSGAKDVVPVAHAVQQQPGTVVPYNMPPPVPVSAWSRWRDILSTAVLVGGLSYTLYQLIRKYILPIWFGPSKEERQMAALEMNINQLQRSVEELVTSMKAIQSSVEIQSENVKQVAVSAAQNRGQSELQWMQDSNGVSEIKQEISSLKGLLLNRKQFPPTPVTQPIIPSWQLAAKSDAAKNENTSPADAATSTNGHQGESSDSDGENKALARQSSSFVMIDESDKSDLLNKGNSGGEELMTKSCDEKTLTQGEGQGQTEDGATVYKSESEPNLTPEVVEAQVTSVES